MLPGGATAEGTARFAGRCARAASGHFRPAQEWMASSLGLGTYLGEDNDAVDAGYEASIAQFLERGGNVLDTAINYRHQRSERIIGRTLSRLTAEGTVHRDEVIIATKGGFIPFESGYAGGTRRYVEDTLIRPGVIAPNDIVAACHCMTPRYLRHQLETSRRNLGCERIDIYYLHNPEAQLHEVARDEFRTRVRAAFEVFEEAVIAGMIACYGTATWNGYRVPADAAEYLSLEDLFRAADEVAGDRHHFRAIQLPFNLAMPEAFTVRNQPVGAERQSLLGAAQELGLTVMASASLLQAQLAGRLPDELRAALDGSLQHDAQRALQFVRSAPGLTTSLVGMSNPAHVAENLALVEIPPMAEGQFVNIFG